MSTAFDLTVSNETNDTELILGNCHENCMQGLAAFESRKIAPKDVFSARCESKESGFCAFEQSTYLIEILALDNTGKTPKLVKLGSIFGAVGPMHATADFTRIECPADSGFEIKQALKTAGGDGEPSFTVTVTDRKKVAAKKAKAKKKTKAAPKKKTNPSKGKAAPKKKKAVAKGKAAKKKIVSTARPAKRKVRATAKKSAAVQKVKKKRASKK